MVVTGEGLGLVVVLGLEVEGQSGQRWLPQVDPLIHHLLRPPSPGPAHADWGASPDPRLAWPRGSDFAALDRADWRYRGNRCSRRDPSAFCPQTSAERNREEKGLLYCWREGRGGERGLACGAAHPAWHSNPPPLNKCPLHPNPPTCPPSAQPCTAAQWPMRHHVGKAGKCSQGYVLSPWFTQPVRFTNRPTKSGH